MQPQRRPRVPIFTLFQDSNYRTIWTAGLLTEVSRRVEQLVLSWFVLQETDSPFQLGLLLVFLNAPRPILSPFTGVFADRFSRRRILLVAQGILVLVAAAILTLFMTDRMEPWHAFVGVVFHGFARALDDPARRPAIFDIVGQNKVVTAMSWEMISNTLGMMAGPLMAGVLISVLGFTGGYECALALHLVAMGLFFLVKIPFRRMNVAAEPFWTSLTAAIQFAVHSPTLMGVLYISLIMNAMSFPTQQFVPAIARDQLGSGPVLVGLLVTAAGIGQLASSGVIGSMRNHQYPSRMFVIGTLVALVMALVFVWSPWYGFAFGIWLLFGIGQAAFGTMQSSIIMLWSPPEMRGRMMSLLFVFIGVGAPIGTLEIGTLAVVLSTQWALTINEVIALFLILPALVLTPMVFRPSSVPPTAPSQE